MNCFSVLAFLLAAGNIWTDVSQAMQPFPRKVEVVRDGTNIQEAVDGGLHMSDEMGFTIKIEGMRKQSVTAKRAFRDKSGTPAIFAIGKDAKKQNRISNTNTDMIYYTDPNGAYGCKPLIMEGKEHCELVGIIHSGRKSCFIKGNQAFCEKSRVGIRKTSGNHYEQVSAPPVLYPGNSSRTREDTRGKRQIAIPSSSVRVIQVAFFLDATIMNRFYQLNDGNITLAQDDAETYITLAANEMTYRLQTVKDLNITYRGGILDLAVNPSHIFYPEENTDFEFLDKDETFLYSQTLDNFRDYMTGFDIEGIWHHAMLVSGLNLKINATYGRGLLGDTFEDTICTDTNKVSIIEDQAFNLVDTAVHELGHALGARHDADGNTCPDHRYIMSSNGFLPSSSTKDTVWKFSSCSGTYFASHLGRYDDCLLSKKDTDFSDNFCAGPRGLQEVSFDYQCQQYHAYGPDWVECFGVKAVREEGCWKPNSVYCYPGTGRYCYSLTYLMDGSPCIGSDPATAHYCYLGACVAEDVICPSTTSATSPTTTSSTTTSSTTTSSSTISSTTTSSSTTSSTTTSSPTTSSTTTSSPITSPTTKSSTSTSTSSSTSSTTESHPCNCQGSDLEKHRQCCERALKRGICCWGCRFPDFDLLVKIFCRDD